MSSCGTAPGTRMRERTTRHRSYLNHRSFTGTISLTSDCATSSAGSWQLSAIEVPDLHSLAGRFGPWLGCSAASRTIRRPVLHACPEQTTLPKKAIPAYKPAVRRALATPWYALTSAHGDQRKLT